MTTDDEKKAIRKRRKFASRLYASKGISCCETPQKYIALCNVGQATGLQKDTIHRILNDHVPNISPPKYVAEKGESHSFLMFNNESEAQEVYDCCNGTVKLEDNGPPIYMIYVNSVPNSEIICDSEPPIGLIILENFITKDEEQRFIEIFNWTEDKDAQSLKNRQVKHYGYEFRYGSNDVDVNSPLEEKVPECCSVLWERLPEFLKINGPPDQMTVNRYLPGQGIPSHVDKHSPFGDTLLSLSLGGSVVMEWRHHTGKFVPVLVEGRSLMVISGEARYDWQHGIQSRTWDPILQKRTIVTENSQKDVTVISADTIERDKRISLTFRWTRTGDCECLYKTLCDSQCGSNSIGDEVAVNLEEMHVHQVYEKIASHFSTTRHKPWPKVVEFMENVPPGSIVLDLGCGNGKNVLPRNDIIQLACERSSGLLAECKSHTSNIPGADCVRIDLLNASLRDACADVIICIAVIHHFSSEPRRLQAVKTIARLLRPGGKALITVWAKDQTKSNYLAKNKHQNTTEANHVTIGGLNLPIHENRTQFQHNDLLVPWKLRSVVNKSLQGKGDTFLRYYHVFEDNELVKLCGGVNGLRVVESFYEEGNWCVVCKKD